MTVSQALVDWGWGLKLPDIPAPVRHAATRHMLDGLGTAIAAARRDVVPFAATVAGGFTAPREATVLADGLRAPAPVAALANGTLVHALDFDDTHARGLVHPTAVVLPAAFAVGELHGRTGADVLVAAVAGYETITRLGAAVRHGFHERGFHATSVCGVFAAALVAARLAGLPPDMAVHALGIAGSQAAGSLEFLHTAASTKQVHPGWASLAGMFAARLAAAGATGPVSIIEGEYGLYAAYATGRPDLDTIMEGLGRRWETLAITIKPYPACQLSHGSLDALRGLADRIGDPDRVESITFEVAADSVPIVCEPLEDKRRPQTPYAAKFSLPWSAAALVVDDRLDLASFDPRGLDRPEILGLADRTSYRSWVPDVPAADAPGRVEVMLRTGDRLVHEVASSRGGPEAPLSDQELIAKFTANCDGPSSAVEELVTRVLGLADQPDVRRIVDLTGNFAPVRPETA